MIQPSYLVEMRRSCGDDLDGGCELNVNFSGEIHEISQVLSSPASASFEDLNVFFDIFKSADDNLTVVLASTATLGMQDFIDFVNEFVYSAADFFFNSRLMWLGTVFAGCRM